MPAAPALTEIRLERVPKLRSGKVREVFDLGEHILIVASDRISAFDVILPNGIPDKGKILSQLSAYWFRRLAPLAANHMVTSDDGEIRAALGPAYDEAGLRGRSMLAVKCEPLPVECVARAYIAGSLYKEYIAAGGAEGPVDLHGVRLPGGLRFCDALPKPVFTPATKAQEGHDENISMEAVRSAVGSETAEVCRRKALELFGGAREHCESAGILLADTKFEFGFRGEELLLIDEAVTPDSSRFWPAESYEPGRAQESLDKQFIRDYLETVPWDKAPPGPELPDEVVRETRRRYIEIFRAITGEEPLL